MQIANWKLTLNDSGSGAGSPSNAILNTTAPVSISKLALTAGAGFLQKELEKSKNDAAKRPFSNRMLRDGSGPRQSSNNIRRFPNKNAGEPAGGNSLRAKWVRIAVQQPVGPVSANQSLTTSPTALNYRASQKPQSPVYKRVGTAGASGKAYATIKIRNSPSATNARASKTNIQAGVGVCGNAAPVVQQQFNNFFQHKPPLENASGIAMAKHADYKAFLEKQRNVYSSGWK